MNNDFFTFNISENEKDFTDDIYNEKCSDSYKDINTENITILKSKDRLLPIANVSKIMRIIFVFLTHT